MNIFKNILKSTDLYRYFNNRFNAIQNKLETIESSINNIENSIPNLYHKLDVLENRTKQFDCINSELLLLHDNSNKPKLLIVGFYGAPNTGDELMLQSILDKIDTNKYSTTIMLADNPKYKLEKYQNVNYIHYPKTNMDINILASYFDKVIFGGGALIEDTNYSEENAYKFNTPTILIELSIASILKGKKVYHLGLSTAKELCNISYISKLDFIINHSRYFSLRDTNSLETLKNSGIQNINKIDIMHDLAFSLPKTYYNFNNINNLNTFTIGLVLIGLSDLNKLKNILVWLDDYSKNINKQIKLKLIPFYDYLHSDIVNFTNILNSLSLHHNIEIEPYCQQYENLMNIFTECNLIINMRYHSSLLSLKAGIPAIHIVYDTHPHYENKMNHLKQTYMLPNLFISFQNLTKGSFDSCLYYALSNITQINLLENSISEKIQEEATNQHTSVINKILQD